MMNWKEHSLAHWELINRMAGRRFNDSVLAEEAALFVMEMLAADDWQRLRRYEIAEPEIAGSGESAGTGEGSAQSSPTQPNQPTLKAYIATLTARLLEDFSRKRFGRKRPPAWIARLGSLWLRLFQLLCLERYSLREAVELTMTATGHAEEQVENAAHEIHSRVVDCGAHQFRSEELKEEGENRDEAPDITSSSLQAERLEELDKRHFLQLLLGDSFSGAASHLAGDADRLLRYDFQLSSEERLLLTLCFVDDLPVTEAGRQLGLNRFQAHGRLKRLLARLRKELEETGLNEELLTLLR